MAAAESPPSPGHDRLPKFIQITIKVGEYSVGSFCVSFSQVLNLNYLELPTHVNSVWSNQIKSLTCKTLFFNTLQTLFMKSPRTRSIKCNEIMLKLECLTKSEGSVK